MFNYLEVCTILVYSRISGSWGLRISWSCYVLGCNENRILQYLFVRRYCKVCVCISETLYWRWETFLPLSSSHRVVPAIFTVMESSLPLSLSHRVVPTTLTLPWGRPCHSLTFMCWTRPPPAATLGHVTGLPITVIRGKAADIPLVGF